MNEFLEKYGTRTLSLLVSKFILASPAFEGDIELAGELGVIMADLEIALREQTLIRGSA